MFSQILRSLLKETIWGFFMLTNLAGPLDQKSTVSRSGLQCLINLLGCFAFEIFNRVGSLPLLLSFERGPK